MIGRLFLLFTLPVLGTWAIEPSGAMLARQIRDADLDSGACYRVRELNFAKDDLKFYLTDGFLIFGKPVFGQRLLAVFSADVEGGDAEVMVLPPHRGERRSLSTFVETPNLNEHFKTGLLLFSDGTGDELYQMAAESGKASVDMGALMRDQWRSLARNISGGFEIRLVQDVLSPDRSSGVFFAALAGEKLGNFDVIRDPSAHQQIIVGKFTTRNGQANFDVWTAFESRPIRTGKQQPPEAKFELSDYRIEAALDSNLHVDAVTRAKLTTRIPSRAIALSLSDKMRLTSVSIDGKPAQLYESESLRAEAIRGGVNNTYLAITNEVLAPGQTYEIEMRHNGDVVVPAGNDVYFVTSRGNWYPQAGSDFANFDLTFRYPKRLTLVATGELVEDRVEGEVRISRRKTNGGVRVAGFNLGQYNEVKLVRPGISIEVFGNKTLEPSLLPREPMVMLAPGGPRINRATDLVASLPTPSNVRPVSNLSAVAERVGAAFDFMRAEFGPAPIRTLTVSPIPGAFGQGFPGLVYLSTIAYLRAEDRPKNLRSARDADFFEDLLPAHEVAHQWMGNYVVPGGYQDEWLMEALAHYAAFLYLEKRRGAKAIEPLLASFEEHLLAKFDGKRTIESVGPITWGVRLEGSQSPDAWRIITYEKGAWILHMLRRRMGDERFHKLMAELPRRYSHDPLTTEGFRKLAEEVMGSKPGVEPLAEFFESWVYGTGIPGLKLNWTARGKAPALKVTGTVTQSGVDDEFSADVPIEIHYAKGPNTIVWVRTSNEPASFSVAVKQAPVRVVLPAGTGVLAVRK